MLEQIRTKWNWLVHMSRRNGGSIWTTREYACPVWHSSLTAAQMKTLESLLQRAMKIIFPAVKSLIFANVDTLESRCEQLTERFFSLTEIVLPTLPASGQAGLRYYRQITPPKKHSSHCWWKLKNFANHLYRTVSNIMISTAGANYILHTNCCRRHWTLALGSFNILLFYCILY